MISDLDEILQRKPEVWQTLGDASLFISGASGWFGRWLLESIVHANARLGTQIRVVALSRDPASFARQAPHLAANPAIRWLSGDVRDFAFPQERFSHVIHAATTSARETFQGEGGLAKFDTLVAGTRRVLDMAAQSGVKHLLFTSSGAAYGAPELERPWREDDPYAPDTLNPMTALGQAKRAAEFLCTLYAQQHGWQLSMARCFSFVGPYMPLDVHYAIGNFIHCALHKQPIIIHGDGTACRSYLYMADLVLWLLTLLQRPGDPALFNVGSDEVISIEQLAERVRSLLNPALAIEVRGRLDANVGNPARNRYLPDISRARNELGLAPWIPLSEAILRTAASVVQS